MVEIVPRGREMYNSNENSFGGEPSAAIIRIEGRGEFRMAKFFLWLILLIICWPVALLALLFYPLVWLLSLPFKLIGITVGGFLAFVKAIFMFPARVLRGAK